MNNSPEWEMLLASAHSRKAHQEASPIEPQPGQSVNWEILLKLASRHGMSPQLYRYLHDSQVQDAPPTVLSRLHLQYRANAARNQELLDELSSLLTFFRVHNIPAIPYKGPALAASVYNDLSLRSCGDLDILLRAGDVLRAKELLTDRAYQPVQQFTSRDEEAQHLVTDCEYNFCRATDGILVELHWRFRPQFFPLPLDMDRLWARAQPMTLGEADTLALAPEDLLLILCVHGAKHCWERLCWISDIAQVLYAYPELDWQQTWAQASTLGCGRVLLLGLALAQQLLGARLPIEAPQRMPAVVDSLTAQVQRQLFHNQDAQSDPRGRMLFHLRVRDHLRDRLPYVKHHMKRKLEERKG